MITFKQLQEKLSDKEYKEVDALLNRDTLLRGNLIKNYAQRGKFETMKARDTFRRIKKNEDGKLRIDRGTEKKIKVNRHTVSKNFPELSKKPVEKYKKYYRLPEGVASLALKGGSKLIPALVTGIGAAGTIMQAQRGRPEGGEAKRYKKKNPNKKRKISDMERKLNDRLNKQNNNNQRTGGQTFDTKGLDLNKKSKIITPKNGQVIQDEFSAPTNNVGGGQIAGTVEAGDNPPVKKKKRYIYGGKGSRKMWLNNK